jgi:hypothetical protein
MTATISMASIVRRGGSGLGVLGSQPRRADHATPGTVGLTAGAWAPETLVGEVVAVLEGYGPLELEEDAVTTERVHFRAPDGVR